MTAPAEPEWVRPLDHFTANGRITRRWQCSCGFVSGLCYPRQGDAAEESIRVHLAIAHDMGDAGHCSECGAPTDYFRGRAPELGEDVWMCRAHAPRIDVSGPGPADLIGRLQLPRWSRWSS